MASPPSPPVRIVPQQWWGTLLLVVLNVRWFLPTEATAEGATLGLAVFWCVAAAITAWLTIERDAVSRRWTRADAAVALLVGGHLISGALVLLHGGQRQLAGNLIAEWLGVAGTWMVIREFLRIPWFRSALWQSTLMSLVLLGAYGCWQHWVELPLMAQRMGPKFDAVRAARATGTSCLEEQELTREGVPLSEPEFTLFEKRLRDSREPFAFFALANTLGGFLAAGTMLLLADMLRGGTGRFAVDRQQRVFLFGAGLCLVAGLLLTKSRTGWVALGAISAIAFSLRWKLKTPAAAPMGKRAPLVAVVILVSLIVVGAGLVKYGSWDRETLAEAPKSLLYRWQYWTGTFRLIVEQPILGGGLGQFRTAYLRVKDPAASEEIADPHNLMLDVWFHGGILAFAGMLWLVLSLFWTTLKLARTDDVAPAFHPLVCGTEWFAIAPWIVFGWQLLIDGAWDDRLLVMGGILISWIVWNYLREARVPTPSRTACGLTALVLVTHLLGAGGIGYTAVMQFLLILLSGTFSLMTDVSLAYTPQSAIWIRRGLTAMAALCALWLWNPLQRSLLDIADGLAGRGASSTALQIAYEKAKVGNPWDPIPCARLAELAFRDVQDEAAKSGSVGPKDIERVTQEWLATIARDPANPHWWHRLGETEFRWHQRHPAPDVAVAAVQHLETAVQRYPSNARWQADLSDAADAAGNTEKATRAARVALAQDEINQRFGHVERILTEEIRQRLAARVADSQASAPK